MDIVKKRRIEARREEIAEALAEARQAWQAGELKPQSADEVIAELNKSLENPEQED